MIDVGADFNIRTFSDNLKAQIDAALNGVLKVDVPAALRSAQAKGFPLDPNDYALLLRNRGKESRRKLSTVQAKYLTIGTARSPLSFTFVAKHEVDVELLAKVALLTLERAFKRSPVRSGQYRRELDIYVGGLQTRRRLFGKLTDTYKSGESVFIMSPVAYASIIEHGFYKKYYVSRKRNGGILINVARAIRRIYGDRLAIRFIYVSATKRGFEDLGAGYGTFPAIQIGVKGSFAAVDTLPGTNKRRIRSGR